jgi:hypothetical protein
MFLALGTSEYKYLLALSSSKYYYRSSDDSLQPGAATVKNYWLTEEMAQSGAEWQFRDTTAYSYGNVNANNRLCLANYNVPIGSASGTEYFFERNIERPTLLNQAQSSTNGATSCTVSMSGCEVGSLLVAAYAVRGASNVVTLSDGWKVLGGGNNAVNASSNHQLVFFASKIAESAAENLTVTQTGTDRIYIVAAEFYGVTSAEIRNEVSNIGFSEFAVTTEKPNAESMMFYAVSSANYNSGRNQTANPDDLIKVNGDSSAERLAGWVDFGGGALSHTFRTQTVGGSYEAVVEAVELFAGKNAYYTTGCADYVVAGVDQVQSSAGSNISWTFEAPEETACDVLVKIGDGDFLAAENGGKIPGLNDGTDLTSTPVVVRVSLSTQNAEVTPVFKSLSMWIKDEKDKNVISLHFPDGNQNSVQNAISAFNVAYNGLTLEGPGGFVEPFDIEVSNDGLIYKGDQHNAEHISVTAQAAGTLTRVYYSTTQDAEHIEVSLSAVGVLTHIDDI